MTSYTVETKFDVFYVKNHKFLGTLIGNHWVITRGIESKVSVKLAAVTFYVKRLVQSTCLFKMVKTRSETFLRIDMHGSRLSWEWHFWNNVKVGLAGFPKCCKSHYEAGVVADTSPLSDERLGSDPWNAWRVSSTTLSPLATLSSAPPRCSWKSLTSANSPAWGHLSPCPAVVAVPTRAPVLPSGAIL